MTSTLWCLVLPGYRRQENLNPEHGFKSFVLDRGLGEALHDHWDLSTLLLSSLIPIQSGCGNTVILMGLYLWLMALTGPAEAAKATSSNGRAPSSPSARIIGLFYPALYGKLVCCAQVTGADGHQFCWSGTHLPTGDCATTMHSCLRDLRER